jgi:hypothetical protein
MSRIQGILSTPVVVCSTYEMLMEKFTPFINLENLLLFFDVVLHEQLMTSLNNRST